MASQVTLSKKAGVPEVTVFIGQAQYGEYTVRLKDPKTGQRTVVAEGDNWDDIQDTFHLQFAGLNRSLLSWSITIAAPDKGPGQAYFARLEIRQGAKLVEGGVFEYSGAFDNTQNIVAATRLHVVP